MRIVFPMMSLERGGGCRYVVEVANGLADRGHEVTIVMHRAGRLHWPLRTRLLVVDELTSEVMPACDVLVPNFWPTVEPALRSGCGRLLRLSMGYEPLWVRDKERAAETYRWPMPVVTISRWHQSLLRDRLGVASTVINPGVDLSVFHPRTGPRPPGAATVLFLYRSKAHGYFYKGQDTFLAALPWVAHWLPALRVALVLTEDLPLDRPLPCRHQVFRAPEDPALAQLYADADLFVSCPEFEAFSLPPLEAMACGTPVITSDCGGVRDYVVPGENALMVPPGDVGSLARAMLRLLTDRALGQRLAQAGVKTAERLPWSRTLDQFEQMLKQVVTA